MIALIPADPKSSVAVTLGYSLQRWATLEHPRGLVDVLQGQHSVVRILPYLSGQQGLEITWHVRFLERHRDVIGTVPVDLGLHLSIMPCLWREGL